MTYRESLAEKQAAIQKEFKRSDIFHKIGFKTKNMAYEEYKKLSKNDRKLLHRWAYEENKEWIAEKMKAYRAAWLLVVDGEILILSQKLDDYPSDQKIMEICNQTNKFPFIFVNDKMLAVEEQGVAWNETEYEEDFYPTLAIKISNSENKNSLSIIADFDTGALGVFIDIDLLIEAGIVKETLFDIPRVSSHLNSQYEYVLKSLLLTIADSSTNKEKKYIKKIVSCIQDWKNSPFIYINPERMCLAGRSLPNELRANVVLDFDRKKTLVNYSGAGNHQDL